MSSGIPSDDTTPRQESSVFRSSAIALGICIAFAFIVWAVGGKELFEAKKLAGDNKKKVEEVAAELTAAESREKRTQSDIAALQKQIDSGKITSKDLEDLLKRLKDLEAGRVKQNDAFKVLAQQASAVEGDRARNRVQIVEAAKLGQNVETELEALEKDITSWAGTNASLAKGEIGRKIAAFPDLLSQYIALTETPVATFDDHDKWKQQFSAVYPRIKSAHKNQEFVVVTKEDIEFLATLRGKVKSAHDTLRKHQRSMNLIIASVKDTDPGQKDLSEAIAERQATRDAAYARQLAEAKKSAQEEVDAEYSKKIAEEQRRQSELLNKQRLQAAELDTLERKKELERIEGQAAVAEQQRKKAALLQEFNRDERTIKLLLAPFLDLAITQPSANNPISKGGIRRPTSLGALQGSGALNNDRSGLNKLYHAGGHPANMRKKGGFPSFVSMSPIPNESVRRTVIRAQELLIKYGDLLVEKGMLSP